MPRTWMKSTGALSPKGRDADTLVAGNALGTMLREVRFRGLLMTQEAMDTVHRMCQPLSNVGMMQCVSYIDSGLGDRWCQARRACC